LRRRRSPQGDKNHNDHHQDEGDEHQDEGDDEHQNEGKDVDRKDRARGGPSSPD
jgi:hypothetical protein